MRRTAAQINNYSLVFIRGARINLDKPANAMVITAIAMLVGPNGCVMTDNQCDKKIRDAGHGALLDSKRIIIKKTRKRTKPPLPCAIF